MGNLKSSVVIAKMLGSEGFSDHVANMVEKYWMRVVCAPRRVRQYRKLDKEITAMCLKLTDADKLILGKFIGLHKKMAFDTGLRIGMTAFAHKNSVDIPDDAAIDRAFAGMKDDPDYQNHSGVSPKDSSTEEK